MLVACIHCLLYLDTVVVQSDVGSLCTVYCMLYLDTVVVQSDVGSLCTLSVIPGYCCCSV